VRFQVADKVLIRRNAERTGPARVPAEDALPEFGRIGCTCHYMRSDVHVWARSSMAGDSASSGKVAAATIACRYCRPPGQVAAGYAWVPARIVRATATQWAGDH
jgi:hypothetical protein